MPTTKTYGTPSAANDALGGVPEIHYFDFASKGRGQVIRLMWEVPHLQPSLHTHHPRLPTPSAANLPPPYRTQA